MKWTNWNEVKKLMHNLVDLKNTLVIRLTEHFYLLTKNKSFNFLTNVTLLTHLLTPWFSSFTTTLLLHAMRSRSVAIWLRRALLCICRTPSIWPLRRSPIFGEDMSIFGLLRAKTKTKKDTPFWAKAPNFSRSEF